MKIYIPETAIYAAPNILRPGDGSAEDDRAMRGGVHYDWQAKEWVEGHDHAHFEHDPGPLSFCGEDAVTCSASRPQQWAA